MATRARIGLQQNKQIISSYQHWDGYPGGLGYKLIEHWEDPNKVGKAIKLGDASAWGMFIGETIDFDKRVKLLTSIEKMLQIPLLELDNNQMQQILNGQLIELTLLSGEYALMNQKKFLGIGQSDGNFIKPIRLIKNEIN